MLLPLQTFAGLSILTSTIDFENFRLISGRLPILQNNRQKIVNLLDDFMSTISFLIWLTKSIWWVEPKAALVRDQSMDLMFMSPRRMVTWQASWEIMLITLKNHRFYRFFFNASPLWELEPLLLPPPDAINHQRCVKDDNVFRVTSQRGCRFLQERIGFYKYKLVFKVRFGLQKCSLFLKRASWF